MKTRILDDFTDCSAWTAVTSGQAELTLTPESGPRGQALRLDFDFRGGGGFVVARKPFAFTLPQAYAFHFALRGVAPPNPFEFKLVDPAGTNVWRYRQEVFDFTAEWRSVRIAGSQIDFAWGPAGGGVPRDIGAIEFVVAAGPGGHGTVWIADLRLEDRTVYAPPWLWASSARPGHEAGCALDGRPDTSWRSAPSRGPAWLLIDFREKRDYGGLILHWTPSPRERSFAVHASDDRSRWRVLYAAPCSAGERSFVYLPKASSRYLRIEVEGGKDAERPGLVAIDVQPEDFSRSMNAFFHQVARHGVRGWYPKWLYREQTYWTPVGIPNGTAAALLNEEGMLEVDRGSFSLEPFLSLDGKLLTWAQPEITQTLERGYLPIPSAVWRWGEVVLTITAFANGAPGHAVLYGRYRVHNLSPRRRSVHLFIAVRPFQVSPPWQGFEDLGGASPVRELEYRAGVLWINRSKAVIPLRPAAACGAAAFDQGAITDYLVGGDLPALTRMTDGFGYASAALRFDLELAPGAAEEIFLAVPFGKVGSAETAARLLSGPERLEEALRQWSGLLGAVQFRLPTPAQGYADACKTAMAHILINRDGPALQPGPRRYARSWIRDSAVMAAALLRLGHATEAGDFIRWYARFQAADGNVPCCVDRKGPDWLPEHDSHGEFIFAVADYFRFTGDRGLVEELWPAVLKAVAYLEHLRSQRLTPDYRVPNKRACFGLLPESVSHEGYLAHPVHAYWDDFWALRGLKDAAELAEVLGDPSQTTRLAALRDDFRATLHASLRRTMGTHGIDFLPGSVEWADADPTAVANAVTLVDEAHGLPRAALERTFALFLARFRAMHSNQVEWTHYTPYEIRIIGALVRLGQRREAHELARFFLSERRPPVWNQWPEIAWHDPRAPGHQGDLPHAWVGAEYILAFRDLFAYERERDRSLVVGAGIPPEWLDAGEVAVAGLPTGYGYLNLRIRRAEGGALRLTLGGALKIPPGGLCFAPPGAGPLRAVWVNGVPTMAFTPKEARIMSFPADVTVIC